MKRLFFFLLTALFIGASFAPEAHDFSLSDFFAGGTLSVFSSDATLMQSHAWQAIVPMGSEWMASCPLSSTPNLSGYVVRGQMAELPITPQLTAQLNQFKTQTRFVQVLTEELQAVGSCEYGYSPLIANYLIIGGKKMNVQIVYKADVIVIGTPVILGSY